MYGRLVNPREHHINGDVRIGRPMRDVHLPASLAAASERSACSISAFKMRHDPWYSRQQFTAGALLNESLHQRLLGLRKLAQQLPKHQHLSAEAVELVGIIEQLEDLTIPVSPEIGLRLTKLDEQFGNQPSDINFLLGVAQAMIVFGPQRATIQPA